MLSDATDWYDVKLGRPCVFRLVTPRGTRPVACRTLAEAKDIVKARASVDWVKLEVWRKHYRFRDEHDNCIGVLRFRGRDPISWKYPPAEKPKRIRTPRKPPERVGTMHFTCAGCGIEFDGLAIGRRPNTRAFHSVKCRRNALQREYNKRASPERRAMLNEKRRMYRLKQKMAAA